MPSRMLEGPYRLTVDEVLLLADHQRCGVYALGAMRGDARFAISYVGGSYGGLKADLLGRIGTAPYFKYRFFSNTDRAFLHLCELFHTFHPSGNFVHPERPKGSQQMCPYCAP